MPRTLTLVACLLIPFYGTANAGVTTQAAKESAEYILKKFGKTAANEGVEVFARKIEKLAAKYGDDAVIAVKKVGPRSFRIIEEAGENGPSAIRLMARNGVDAVWIVSQKKRMAIFVKYGDDAADAMMKHGQLAEPLLTTFGQEAASAFKSVSAQNGRRLAMMTDSGELARIGRTAELLKVVGRYGDRAMNFIWKHKDSLAAARSLTAFLESPEPYIESTQDISLTPARTLGKPVITESPHRAYWLLIALVVLAGIVVVAGRKIKTAADSADTRAVQSADTHPLPVQPVVGFRDADCR
jgi:hypothetical protein